MKVLVTAPYNEAGLQELKSKFDEVDYHSWKENGRGYQPEELAELLKRKPYSIFITEHDDVNRIAIDACPTLRLIGVCRGTPSNVDTDYANQKGIQILNTPGRNAQAVAEMFIANVITFYRKTIQARQWLMDGKWEEGAHTSYLEFKGNELAGKTVGMVGFGAVGQHIARMLEVFPCGIQYYDPYYQDENQNYEPVELEMIFESSDIVAINLPVNDTTRGMIGRELISRMKSNAVFVNMSRAAVVDREALIAALEAKAIRGAILDVFDHEPPDEKDMELIRRSNVLATPHIAGATYEVEDHHVRIMNEKLEEWMRNK